MQMKGTVILYCEHDALFWEEEEEAECERRDMQHRDADLSVR